MKSIRRITTIMLVIALLVVSAAPTFAASAKPLKSINLSKTSGTLNKGTSITLKVTYSPADTTDSKAIVWTSSNTKVASVSGGRVTAKAPGTATITATSKTGKKATYKVTVKSPITKVSLNITGKTITAGDGFGITVSYAPATTTDSKTVTWTSSNTKVATVKNGYITGLNAGTAVITAKMGTKTATCKVTVKARTIKIADAYTQLNNYRKKANLKALKKDANLEKVAKTRAAEIKSLFEHQTKYTFNSKTKKFVKGSAVRQATKLIKDVMGNVWCGENIAKGQKTPAEVTKAWYNSTGHRANMLSKNYTRVGIAAVVIDGTVYWVQAFSSEPTK